MNDERKIIGYRVDAGLEFAARRRFKTKWGADRYLEKIEAKLTEANKICDGEIWTSCELIYETRWDCPTARLAAALRYLHRLIRAGVKSPHDSLPARQGA